MNKASRILGFSSRLEQQTSIGMNSRFSWLTYTDQSGASFGQNVYIDGHNETMIISG